MNTFQARIGYARTSTVDQNLDAQIQALTAAGCGIVRQEQRSGTTLEGRVYPNKGTKSTTGIDGVQALSACSFAIASGWI